MADFQTEWPRYAAARDSGDYPWTFGQWLRDRDDWEAHCRDGALWRAALGGEVWEPSHYFYALVSYEDRTPSHW